MKEYIFDNNYNASDKICLEVIGDVGSKLEDYDKVSILGITFYKEDMDTYIEAAKVYKLIDTLKGGIL